MTDTLIDAALFAAARRTMHLEAGVDQPAVDPRTPYAHDWDRVLYSDAFRRLGNVTQVVAVNEMQLFHNRLTHSVKVEQIGRRLGQRLNDAHAAQIAEMGGLDENAVGAACLAHDLGHPPFGHIAEKALQGCLATEAFADLDSFEGNAQSFRIVTKLANRDVDPSRLGLNLTRATLRGVLKYPWLHGEAPVGYDDKWGAYRTESTDFRFAVETMPDGRRSLEAEVMDWADDVTYAVHDVQDFYRVGLVPLDRLRTDASERQEFLATAVARLTEKGYDPELCAQAMDNLFQGSLLVPARRFRGTRQDAAGLQVLGSFLINRYLDAVFLLENGELHRREPERHEVALLKELTWFYVIDAPGLATLQRGQVELITKLFRRLMDWAVEADSAGTATKRKRERARLPSGLRMCLDIVRQDDEAVTVLNASEDLLRARAVTDYIAMLTEGQAVELYRRLTGESGASALDGWLATC